MNDLTVLRKKFSSFDLDGNNLALDFVNTVEYRGTEKEIEWLTSYLDALCWAERVEIFSPEETAILSKKARNHDSHRWYKQVRSSRETLHSIFSRIIDKEIDDCDKGIRDFNDLYQTVHRRIKVSSDLQEISWNFPELEASPLGFLQPVIHTAAELLVSGNLGRLKRCSDPTCGWLYYDTSKNNSRRWCSMKTCGNRAKVNRFYQTHQ